MTGKTEKAGMDRRRFLLGASVGATAAAASQFVGGSAQAMDPGPDETKSRYKESDHVKTFYRVNGYEGSK